MEKISYEEIEQAFFRAYDHDREPGACYRLQKDWPEDWAAAFHKFCKELYEEQGAITFEEYIAAVVQL